MRRLAGDVHIPDPMDAPSIRWGIIGASGIARTMCTAINSYTTSRVVAVAAREPSRAKAFARDNDVERAVDSYEELVACDDVDAVYVSTIHPYHARCALMALRAGKPVLVEKPFTPTIVEAKELFALAKSKGLTVTPYQNRRFDSCFLTAKKAIESGKLGEIVEIESHFDYYRPVAETQPGLPQDGSFYGLGVHTMDQIISLFGRPDHVAYDIRSLRNKANPDDTFEAQLFYGDLKAIVKTSHLVKIDYPKFIVHGKKGSFIKYGIDQQETSLKANIMPGEPGFAADDSVGVLEYVNDEGLTVREELKPETGDYGRVYDALYD
ncbi:MAG: oxidoreductase, partial [Actinomyces sp.]|nr:oxidoreductase [Actinomyces sp.]